MLRLRAEIDPERERHTERRATAYPTARNRHGLHCRECGGVYYVDDVAYEKVKAGLALDATENPFICDDCDEGYAEDAHVR